jgi:hypothetical protein
MLINQHALHLMISQHACSVGLSSWTSSVCRVGSLMRQLLL